MYDTIYSYFFGVSGLSCEESLDSAALNAVLMRSRAQCCVWQLSLFPVIVLNYMTDRVAFTHAMRATHQADFRDPYEDQTWSCERCESGLGRGMHGLASNVM